MFSLCGCQSHPSHNNNPSEVNSKPSNEEETLDTAIKISGKKFSPDQRSMMLRMLSLSEEDLIRGLTFFLEFSDGRYPSRMEAKTTLPETEALWKAKYGKSGLNTEKTKEQIHDIFFASAFYDKLVREKKDVAYYGDKVTVEDSDKVLMRWKIRNNEYRVVFGNLTIRNMNTEELVKIEQLFP